MLSFFVTKRQRKTVEQENIGDRTLRRECVTGRIGEGESERIRDAAKQMMKNAKEVLTQNL